MHYKETRYGFEYGAANVTRMFSDEKKGWVTIGLETPRHSRGKELQVYVTRTGKVRIFDRTGEWLPPKKTKQGE